MMALIVAGEMIFTLPFVVARVFRPTLLDVFGLTNLELGTAFSVYGIVAMASYFPGGPLADRFSARRLMTAALVATALGGGVFATIPAVGTLTALYAFWGLTTILLFWAALMRATREWGGEAAIGRAYGILDGGRGLVSALLASVMVAIFAGLLPTDVASATMTQRSAAFGQVIWIFAGLTLAAAALVWISIPEAKSAEDSQSQLTLAGIPQLLRMPSLWFQAVIIICGYVGFKSSDDFSLYARDAFGYDEVAAAQLGTVSFWVRPFAALGAGLLADRIGPSRIALMGFGTLIFGCFGLIFQPGIHWALVITVAGTSLGIYAVRSIYYSLLGEARVPLAVTGGAIGLVSVIGYTPDVFMGPVMGYLLDRSPGALGHQHVFLFVAGSAVIGLIATLLFQRFAQTPPLRHWNVRASR
ncbi:MAG: MFS transporter [Acidobacteria bacterium]|nr:MFS transporter [Acidobacteriota bacterium]MDA1235776.1 MFS transporter [Acidobacteriota bacterium]